MACLENAVLQEDRALIDVQPKRLKEQDGEQPNRQTISGLARLVLQIHNKR